jgi:hypothetical protein
VPNTLFVVHNSNKQQFFVMDYCLAFFKDGVNLIVMQINWEIFPNLFF